MEEGGNQEKKMEGEGGERIIENQYINRMWCLV